MDDNDDGHDGKEPIDWRYRFHIFFAYFVGLNFREYPQKIWPYMVQYLHFRILEFPLIKWRYYEVRKRTIFCAIFCGEIA